MKLLGLVFCFLCVSFLEASETYRAGVIQDKGVNDYTSLVYEAGKSNVDILVLPTPETSDIDNYDEIIQSVSKAAKQSNIYVVAHLYEKAHCENNDEVVKSNIVFDREGAIVSVYRKPVSSIANCTTTPSELVTFTTDFDVTFGSLMAEDIVLHGGEYMNGLKNFVMAGLDGYGNFLSAAQFSPSWTFVNNANLISSTGIYSKSGVTTGSGRLLVADLEKNGRSGHPAVPIIPSISSSSEDLSHYIIKALDLEASSQGYKETVCHGSFCCEFYVKTRGTGPKSDASYSLAVFDGVSSSHKIGSQDCSVIACDGDYKNCESRSNSTNILFERISITANFTKQNVQYPILHSSVVPTEKFNFDTKTTNFSKQVTLQIVDGQNVKRFGVYGRDISKDFLSFSMHSINETYDVYDLIFNENVCEFFDYVWIRLKILLVIVSIYILEMM